ncbi:MAG: ABC-type Mn2+/Zn2+ transport system, permease component [Phycisphaerales bacterium]|nr:ABC-type Mn2+/Zn2+ transport system, permease component [Phycisphaerales bacterium]
MLAMLDSSFNAYTATAAMAVSCAILSVFVVARRWAFMGEGISHSGFGGAGTAWMLMVAFPSLAHSEGLPYLFVTLFCFGTAVAIGWLASGRRVTSDTAIGIFLVASLAWGFIGQNVYTAKYHATPAGFDNLLFGQMRAVSGAYMKSSVAVALAVIATAVLLGKELIAYCVDPLLARTSGVRTTFIHYTLMVLLALVIVTGIRIVGSVLVTALLVLPAASANLISRRLSIVVGLSVVVAMIGAWGGLLVSEVYRAVPAGSAIVLVMFVVFLAALAMAKLRRV